MKLCSLILVLLLLISINTTALISNYQYISPLPESNLNSNNSQIIIRHSELIDRKKVSENIIIVNGEKSGIHNGKLDLSDDSKTLVFKPETPFIPNEIVNVKINSGVKTLLGAELEPYSFRFFVSSLQMPLNGDIVIKDNESGISDFSSEIFSPVLSSLFNDKLKLFYFFL